MAAWDGRRQGAEGRARLRSGACGRSRRRSAAPASTKAAKAISGKPGAPSPGNRGRARSARQAPPRSSSGGAGGRSRSRPWPRTGPYRTDAGRVTGPSPTRRMRYGPRPKRLTASSAALSKSAYAPASSSSCTITHSPSDRPPGSCASRRKRPSPGSGSLPPPERTALRRAGLRLLGIAARYTLHADRRSNGSRSSGRRRSRRRSIRCTPGRSSPMKRSALHDACRAHLGGRPRRTRRGCAPERFPSRPSPDDPRPRTAGSGE